MKRNFSVMPKRQRVRIMRRSSFVSGDECAICMCEENSETLIPPCGHEICAMCMKRIKAIQNKCPTCRDDWHYTYLSERQYLIEKSKNMEACIDKLFAFWCLLSSTWCIVTFVVYLYWSFFKQDELNQTFAFTSMILCGLLSLIICILIAVKCCFRCI
jgi:uncharacterized membrane protein (GlpM family)